jgi:hypothetical protein
MSIRIDYFRENGAHTHVVYGNVTGELVHREMAFRLRNGVYEAEALILGDSPIRTVVMGHTDEEPWF